LAISERRNEIPPKRTAYAEPSIDQHAKIADFLGHLMQDHDRSGYHAQLKAQQKRRSDDQAV
jgi:hypothetical protein